MVGVPFLSMVMDALDLVVKMAEFGLVFMFGSLLMRVVWIRVRRVGGQCWFTSLSFLIHSSGSEH